MTETEKQQVRAEINRIILNLKLKGRRPDPSAFSPLLTRVLKRCNTGDDVLAIVINAVRDLTGIGGFVANYIARNRDAIIDQLTPELRLLKGGADVDAA